MLRSLALPTLVWMLILSACCSTTQAQTLLPTSTNGQFRTGLAGWNASNSNATVVQAVGSNGRLKLAGAVGLWQIVPVSGISEYQLLNCQAFKKLKNASSSSSPGWAGIGINYYDAAWGYIDGFQTQINVSDSLNIVGEVKLLPCSVGTTVPADAVHAVIWVANDDANSDVMVDNLFLFDYLQFNSALAAKELGTDPSFLQDLDGQSHETSGLEFWNVQGSIDMGSGKIGTVGTPSSISQEFKLTPGKTFTVDWFISSAREASAPPANIGVDFFDANWVRIGGDYSPLPPNSFGFGSHLAVVPQQTVHSIVWIWVDALTENTGYQQLGPVQLNVRPLDETRPTVSLYQPVADRGPGDQGLDILLDYRDDQPNSVNLFTNEMTLTGPTGATYLLTWLTLADDEDPTHFIIKLQALTFAGQPIDWSREAIGTYTLIIPPESVADFSGNTISAPLTTTFQNKPAATAR